MSDMTTITPEKLVELRKHAAEYCEENLCCHIKPETMLGLLDALERAEARSDGGLMEELKRATAIIEKKEARVKLLEKELDGADSEIASLKDELEDSRGTEKDAPNVMCAIARLVGVYEHSQELGDDMGTLVLEAVSDLLAEKQKYDPRALTWTHEPPKVAGWYWCRECKSGVTLCVEVYGASSFLLFGSKRDDFNPQRPVTVDGIEWAGPIPAPIG